MKLFENKIVKNFSILTATNLLIQFISIFSSIRLARQLQPEGYGIFNLVAIQASIFSVLAAYGLRIVIIRHIARNRNDAAKIFFVSNQIRTITTILAFLLVILYNQIEHQHSLSNFLLLAILLLIVFQTFWDSIESVFFGFENMGSSGIINLIFTVLWVVEIYIIPNRLFSPTMLIYAYALNQVAKSLIYYIWLRKSILSKSSSFQIVGYGEHKELIRQSNFFFVLAVFTAIQNQMPVLLLQFNSTVDQIGLFNLGYRILSPLQMVLNVLLTSLFPMLTRLAIDDQALFARRIKSLINIIILTGVWGSMCFALFSKDIVSLLYGKAYVTSANVILIQCWFTLLMAIFCTIGNILSALDKQKLLSQLSIIYVLIAAPIFFIGTKYGATGLAWAFVIAGLINLTYHWVILRNLLQNGFSLLYSFGVFAVIGGLSICTYFYEFDLYIWEKLIICAVISSFVFIYLYQIEYKKILKQVS